MADTRTKRGARAAKATATAETAPVQEDTNMSDINETQDTPTENPDAEGTEGQEPEAGTEAAGHVFNVGDEARVVRGKLRTQHGQIIAYNEADKTYAIKLASGTLAVVNAANLKAPQDSTVSVRALVAALASFEDRDAAVRLAAALDATVPGVSAKLNEATAS